jgi:hypothetical protein
MDKIFDHSYAYRGWQEMSDPAAYIQERWNDERWCDRDQCATYLIEHWSKETGVITYHVASVTGYYYGEDPQLTEYIETDPAMAKANGAPSPTDQSPSRDYILISRSAGPSNKWPPKSE